eukprot:NODE_572_length_1472_cov_565.161609.p1 GENE.NODE_572_length_1472_cov_565.161609~~NODE_572_length_1472_cov_565.161609.p1  ORF type:complete len:326 (-),score=120.56 NODE_572_length_1472_cov_565.161609:478-1416(-)
MRTFRTLALLAAVACTSEADEDVLILTKSNFSKHLKDYKQTLISFHAPWCGHCKKLVPEFEGAAGALKDSGVKLASVDATVEVALASQYKVQGFPTIIWFEEGLQKQYEGTQSQDAMVEWVQMMVSPTVTSFTTPQEPTGWAPVVTLRADSILKGFEDAAKANREKAEWHFVRMVGSFSISKVTIKHAGEELIEMPTGGGDTKKVTQFLDDNLMPLFGELNGNTFDRYMHTELGLIWALYPPKGKTPKQIHDEYDSVMRPVAAKYKSKYNIVYTNVVDYREAIEGMLGVASSSVPVHRAAEAGRRQQEVCTV